MIKSTGTWDSNSLKPGGALLLVEKGLKSVPSAPNSKVAKSVTTLNISSNEIRSCYSLSTLECLTTLILDKNGLQEIPNDMPKMNSIHTLWCNNNKISDLPAFIENVSRCFPHLTTLSLMRNPACPGYNDISSDNSAANRRYRLYVISCLPNLEHLDCTTVSFEEAKEASRVGKYCCVRRPSKSQYSSFTKNSNNSNNSAKVGKVTPPDVQKKVRLQKRKSLAFVCTFYFFSNSNFFFVRNFVPNKFYFFFEIFFQNT
eukprot:GSMAST32.ASY1.ANO1.667.1 assembled CDS